MKILYFAPIAYNGLKQRPQHIAELLSFNNEIWYIEPTISIMKYLLKGGRNYKLEQYDQNPNLHIIKLDGRFTAHISLQYLDFLNLNILSEYLQLRRLINECDIIWVGYSGWYNLISKLKNKKIIYDKMDDDANLTLNKLLKRLILKVEPKLIKKADIIFVTAIKFYQEISSKRDNVYYIPNAFNKNIEVNNNILFENNTNTSEKKVFGYIGTLAHWFDIKAINTILEADITHYVYLVGPCQIAKINHERVKYFGVVDKTEIGKYINFFDICLFPFLNNKLLNTIDPVKIYEYLALNKPVIAINSIETNKFGQLIHTYRDYNELRKLSKTKLDLPFNFKSDYDKFFVENTWEKRVNDILKILDK
ncbi:hypothetical protein Ana3638_09970 [Anaerocolumna sedimenticola]|uniref:Uncharacterized protein n=1 Tax=Anaerocolumna sedimenticola TaxID=2696063 RepID=A0A6P1TMH0_9FIRM|nr:glycosyltransferase family 1 protein [Anaerocolumna sedimenticola]QHQ61056.1 hypothetical protein Ana3638_09970 [Anaerocolumna sedimenticola]